MFSLELHALLLVLLLEGVLRAGAAEAAICSWSSKEVALLGKSVLTEASLAALLRRMVDFC